MSIDRLETPLITSFDMAVYLAPHCEMKKEQCGSSDHEMCFIGEDGIEAEGIAHTVHAHIEAGHIDLVRYGRGESICLIDVHGLPVHDHRCAV